MIFEPGTKLYLYGTRNGTFTVHEGIVVEGRYGNYPRYHRVAFETRLAKAYLPKPDEVGVVQTCGPRLWLTERDDLKAKELFLEHERKKLAGLEKQVEKKRALIKMLESVGEYDEKTLY